MDDILELLAMQAERSSITTGVKPYVGTNDVFNRVVPPREREYFDAIWNSEIYSLINKHESRVQLERQHMENGIELGSARTGLQPR